MAIEFMNKEHQQNTVNCSQFEELLSDYLEKTLDGGRNKAVAAHALSCPLCHSLLNDVKESLAVCREIAAPALPMTRLEARILSKTNPLGAMACDDFEAHLTDYLDGFLPAAAFHRWERHASLCSTCEDLPGMVVRSIAACYTYKMDELAVPAGLHERILNLTSGSIKLDQPRSSWVSDTAEWIRGLRFPAAVPQLAPVAMILAFAFLMFGETVSADGTIAGIYQRSVELAGQTYQQSSAVWGGKPAETAPSTDPITGTTYVNGGEQK
jgi:anti-sigma factor RsiW